MLNVCTPEEALNIIRREFAGSTAETEVLPLSACLGRVLAEDITANEYVPDFDRSTVDGYAVRASDTFGCSDSTPAILKLRGIVGMGQASGLTSEGGALDLVLTNALVVDPVQGIVKADIGIKDGRIAGIGKAGNPDIMEGVTPGLTVGASTEALAAEGLIVTAGGLDTHIHFISPQQIETALYSGITTMIGGGTGPWPRT